MPVSMGNVLITGGLGGVGYHTTKAFLDAGERVRLLEIDTPANRKRLRSLSKRSDVVWGDVTSQRDVERALEGVDAVVHLAAVIPPRAVDEPELARRVNVEGTRTVVEAIQAAGRRIPLVFTSSVAVFGDTSEEQPPLHPDRQPMAPHAPYDRDKAKAEMLVRESGLDFLVLRLGAVPPIELQLSTLPQMFMIPYDTRMEFTHVLDAATAILHSVQRFDQVKNQVLVVSGGPANRMRFHEFVARSIAPLGLPLPPKERFTNGPTHLDWYDTSDSQRLLEYQSRTVDDYVRDLYRPVPRPARALMRRVIGPLFGRLIMRMV